ncbi:MAG: hypothetical protein R3B37_02070 [Nitrospira sp.]|nr:hypothetical protein [Nitrospira sp.]
MKVICSWCQSEGQPGLVREKAPLADLRETHGICTVHLQQMGVGPDPLVPSYDETSLSRHESGVIRRRSLPAVLVMNERRVPGHPHPLSAALRLSS